MTEENPNKIDMGTDRTIEQWSSLYQSVKDNLPHPDTGKPVLTPEEQKYYIGVIEPKVLTTSDRCEAVIEDMKAGASDISDAGGF